MAIGFNNVSYFDEIKDVSFEIESGFITGIVGSSNSGKSILVDLLSGVLLPSSGDIFIDDNHLSGYDEYVSYINSCGVLYQDFDDQFFFDSVKDEMMFVLKKHKVRSVKKKILDSLKIVGLNSNVLERHFFELSLSEKKRIAFGLILSYNPKIIILDEPFLGLDKKSIDVFIKLIRMMKMKYGKTIIISSKDTNMIHKICDSVILINDGSIYGYGDKYSILADKALMEACNLKVPNIIDFSLMTFEKKKIDLGFRDDINDLAKDIYRFVR